MGSQSIPSDLLMENPRDTDSLEILEGKILTCIIKGLEFLEDRFFPLKKKNNCVITTELCSISSLAFLFNWVVSLSLASNNLSTEFFPTNLSYLSALKALCLDNNPIVSLPNGVRTLPSIEILSMNNCRRLTSVEYPPQTLKWLFLRYWKPGYKLLLRKILFNREMAPLKLIADTNLFAPSSFEVEGMIKIQPMAGVEENLLRSLGWPNLKLIENKNRFMVTLHNYEEPEESEVQMYFAFGIFSTILPGNLVIPSRNKPIYFETSTSFTIPSTFNELRGLNLCIVGRCFELPKIRMSNITKNCTWIYNHCIRSANAGGECLTFLSHWMFGMNEMEVGDEISITLENCDRRLIYGCWVHLVYDSVDDMTRRLKWYGVDYGKMENEEEEDPLDYYKSWNHIIGGDLSPFQLTTGEYFLNSMEVLQPLYSYVPRGYFKATEVECSVLPNRPLKYSNTSIKNWQKGRFLGSGSHGIVSEGLTNVDDMTRRFKYGVDYGKMENEEEEEEEEEEKEEDPLDYYKSWNHIIGGDLSPFQLTMGEYFINSLEFSLHLYSCGRRGYFKENVVSFRAFSQTRPDMFDGLPLQNYSPCLLPHAIPSRIIVPEHQVYTETGGTVRATEVECSVLPNRPLKDSNTSIKNWRKGRFLGSGSHGIVYEGLTKHGIFFAVKEVSLLDEGRGKQSIVQLEQEISLLSQFKHKNIVRYLGTDTCDDKLYIFLELVTKGSLANLYQNYHLEDSLVSAYTRQILGGLNYLHERGVVHRDIKCANILVDANGSVKLADFGLAKVTKLNDIKSSKGSPYWMAPEVVNPKNNGYGLAADIWSLGCTVLEMLTSKIPYSPLEPMQAVLRIGRGELPPIPDTLSVEAKNFILECLQVNQNDRPTAAQLLIHPFVKAQSL